MGEQDSAASPQDHLTHAQRALEQGDIESAKRYVRIAKSKLSGDFYAE